MTAARAGWHRGLAGALLLLLLGAGPALPATDGQPPGGTAGEDPATSAGSAAADVDPDALGDEFFEDEFADDEDEAVVTVADPLEPINRGIFWVNDKLYFYLFKPLARVYRVVPQPVRTSVDNFFSNVGAPVRIVNAFLQARTGAALSEFFRFLVNTTAGIGGLFDPASHMPGLEKKEADFGRTLGAWGLGHGFYLVLPVLGPSSARDGVGRFADQFADPWYYVTENRYQYYGAKAAYMVNWLSLDKDTYEGIVEQALDPYLDVRNAYVQHRAAKIKEGLEEARREAFPGGPPEADSP